MLVRQMLEIYDLLDTPQASGEAVAALLRERGAQDVTVTVVGGAIRVPLIASKSSFPVVTASRLEVMPPHWASSGG